MENKKPLILIADDDNDFRGIMEMKLKSSGFDVVTVTDGIEVEDKLNELGETRPDLLILDLQMPLQNGFETFNILKHNTKYSSIKTTFLTSYGDPESLTAGTSDNSQEMHYIKKGDDLDFIVGQIKKLIAS